MQSASSPKPRRFARACDACHRRKVRCDFQTPACSGCVKAGIECKFTTVKRAGKAAGKASEQQETVAQDDDAVDDNHGSSFGPDYVAGDAVQYGGSVESNRRHGLITSLNGSPRPTQPNNDNAVWNGASPQDYEQLLGIDTINELVLHYFNSINQVFPIFEKDRFLHVNNTTLGSREHAIMRACRLFMVLLALHQRRSLSTRSDRHAAIVDSQLIIILQDGMRQVSSLLFEQSSFSLIQLLLIAASYLWTITPGDQRASTLVAAAARMIHYLHPDGEEIQYGTTSNSRLRHVRLFWCLYVLDIEMSCHNGHPASISDDDLTMELLMLEPRMYPLDRAGIISSEDGSACLNLFVARQRLARIQHSIQRNLLALGSVQRGKAGHVSNVNKCIQDLAEWEQAWFDYDRFSQTAPSWTRADLTHILYVQRLHFVSLRRIQSVMTVPSQFGSFEDSITKQARQTLMLHETIRDGAKITVSEVSEYIISCLTVLLSPLSREELRERDRSMLNYLDPWIQQLKGMLNEMPSQEVYVAANTLVHNKRMIDREIAQYTDLP